MSKNEVVIGISGYSIVSIGYKNKITIFKGCSGVKRLLEIIEAKSSIMFNIGASIICDSY